MRKVMVDIGKRFAIHLMNEDVLIRDLHKHAFNVTEKEAEFLEQCIRKHK
jgi:hypothetical protein